MASDLEIRNNIKKSLISWYLFEDEADILYVGSSAEAWAQGINCRNGKIEFKTVKDLLKNTNSDLPDSQYDYIVLIEKLEYIHNPKDLLNLVRKLLKETGVLLLGINNRFGLRYFCGDRDKYTGRNFDGIENYKRAYAKKEDTFAGRMYSQAEIKKLLGEVGFFENKFYSVLSNLDNPTLLFSENYYPNEDLGNRVFPLYENPDTVFLEEESLYQSLMENNMFHQMANAYLCECSLDGHHSDVLQVTSSAEREEKNAFLTVIRGSDGNGKANLVEKRPLYEAGLPRLKELEKNSLYLREQGISTIDGKIVNESFVMPYVEAEVGQLYLKKLLLEGKQEEFLDAMDHFRDLILKSSEIIEPDKGDGKGAVLQKGFIDMVPLNSFYVNGEFVFFDQEFAVENYPANVLIFRMIATFFYESLECERILPREVLFDRYNLTENLAEWRKTELDFLAKLRNEKELEKYHNAHRRKGDVLIANRQRMNYSQEQYEKLFVDIFDRANTRKLILFGSGNYTKRFISIFSGDYDIYAIVDNNPAKWGTTLDGIEIQSPDILKTMDNAQYKVIICIRNYVSVMKQLDDMGVGGYSIYEWNRSYPKKMKNIISQRQSDSKAEEALTKKKYHIGYVAGAFDMFHVGHLNLLRKAKEQCDYLIAGVIADETIYDLKKKKPIIPLIDRVEIVSSCKYVDQAEPLPVGYNGIKEAYKMFHFDVQFSGNDHDDDEKWLEDKAYLESQGADIVFFEYTEKVSSTKLREDLKNS